PGPDGRARESQADDGRGSARRGGDHRPERLPARPDARSCLEVAERVDGAAVDPHLEMEVRPEAVPGAADVADRLALAHVLAARDGDLRLVAVGSGEVAAVVDHDEVAVAALPPAVDDGAGGGGGDRRH